MADRIERIEGRGCALRGDDIDTDRIIPARYLRCVTFDGLGEYAFADDREQAKGAHPLDADCYQGSEILIAGRNFGCGSSREHAPQSLMRWGFRAFIAESFAEIFFGNCTALGLPCVVLAASDLRALMTSIEASPEQSVTIDLAAQTVHSNAGTFDLTIPSGARDALVEGTWNATSVLLEAGQAIERTANDLPYIESFPARL